MFPLSIAMEGGAWCARDISLRAQKKFLSRVGGAASARALVLDEHAAKLLDQVLYLLKLHVYRKAIYIMYSGQHINLPVTVKFM